MGTMIRDPNAPPDPSEVRDIPDAQHPADSSGNPHNPVAAGAPPNPDYPTGVPPYVPPTDGGGLEEIEPPPVQPPDETPPLGKGKTAKEEQHPAAKKK